MIDQNIFLELIMNESKRVLDSRDILARYFKKKENLNPFKAAEKAEKNLLKLNEYINNNIIESSRNKIESLFNPNYNNDYFSINQGYFEVEKIVTILRSSLDPNTFELLGTKILEKSFNFSEIKKTKQTRDGGYDFEGKYKVQDKSNTSYYELTLYGQAKFYSATINRQKIDEFFGFVLRKVQDEGFKNLYMIITSSQFSSDALQWAKRLGVLALDGYQIGTLLYRYNARANNVRTEEIVLDYLL